MAKQPEINEVFEHKWANLKCVHASKCNTCEQCYFFDRVDCLDMVCLPEFRTDEEQVIFIRIKIGGENEG